jgi:hypothetical protein
LREPLRRFEINRRRSEVLPWKILGELMFALLLQDLSKALH